MEGPPNLRITIWWIRALILAWCVLAPGCVFFHVPYDDVSLSNISELEQRTREVVADGDRGRLSLKQSRRFLEQSQAQASVLRVRGALNKTALVHLDAVDRSYATLLERPSPIRTSNTAELRSALSNLHALGVSHGVWVSNYNPPPTSITDDDDFLDSSRKDCDRKNDHKHRDRDHDDDKHHHHDKDKDKDDDHHKGDDDDDHHKH